MALPSVGASGSQLGADTLSSFNVGASAAYLLVATAIYRANTIGDVTGVTFNGNAMSLLDSDLVVDRLRLKVWGKTVTPSETGNIVQTVSGSIVGKAIGAVSIVNWSSTGTTAKNKQTTGASLSATGLTAGATTLVVDFLAQREVNSNTPAQDASQALIFLTNNAGENQLGTSSKANTTSMTWASLNNNDAIIIAVPLVGLDDGGGAGVSAYIRRYHRHIFGG